MNIAALAKLDREKVLAEFEFQDEAELQPKLVFLPDQAWRIIESARRCVWGKALTENALSDYEEFLAYKRPERPDGLKCGGIFRKPGIYRTKTAVLVQLTIEDLFLGNGPRLVVFDAEKER